MNLVEITNRFPSEYEAIKHFEKVKWYRGRQCPYCASRNHGNRNKDHRFHCNDCRKTFSVTTKTKLHNTRLPLRTWLMAFALITDAKKGISAKQLERNLGIHYETAWSLYMRVREMMAEPVEPLDGIVEMDETFIGGKPRKSGSSKCLPGRKRREFDERLVELADDGFEFKEGSRKVACAVNVKRGRGTKNIPVVGIVQRDGSVVAQVMQSLTKKNLQAMVKKHVDRSKSVIVTDSYSEYNQLHKIIEHVKIDHKEMYSYKGINTNTIESFWAIVERGIMGQYHKVSLKYLPNYVAEFVFKFNNRAEDDMFETLVRTAMKAA